MLLQSIDILPIIYNVGIFTILVLWLTRKNHSLETWVRTANIKLLWIIFFIIFIFSFLANLSFLGSDVDDAVISGTMAFVNQGINPYMLNPATGHGVVIHYDRAGNQILGLYHYFPTDLFIHSFMYLLFGFLGQIDPALGSAWFLLGNLIFVGAGYVFARKIVDIDDLQLFPIYGILTSFFLFSNSSLAILYFLAGFYLLKKAYEKTQPILYDLGILGYIFSAGVKYATGLLLIILFLEELFTVRKWQDLKAFRPYVIGSIILLVIIIPFGTFDVLKATFLDQGEITSRAEVAGIYGPALVELFLVFFQDILAWFTIVFILAAILSIIIAFKIGKSTYEKQMLLIFLFMFILPFYGTEFLFVPLLLWMFSIFGFELNFPNNSYLFKSVEQ